MNKLQQQLTDLNHAVSILRDARAAAARLRQFNHRSRRIRRSASSRRAGSVSSGQPTIS